MTALLTKAGQPRGDYETRADELSLSSHRRLYDNFDGLKRELRGDVMSGPE
jgi:hypothetical protein